MKSLNTSILSKITSLSNTPRTLNLLKNTNKSFVSIKNVSTKNKINRAFFNLTKFEFSENANNNEEDTHSDFKPKSKVEITDDNVIQMIDEWIKNNDVVLFMKGIREMPRCGFSNYAVQILKFYNIKDFKVINILENPIVREAVKKYSNWPTYPQLYVKGNLVGGCDIIKEMHENGSFKEMVEREKIGANIVDV